MYDRHETRDGLGRLARIDFCWDAKLKGAPMRSAFRTAMQAAARYRQWHMPDGDYSVATRTDLPDRVRIELTWR